MASQRDARLRLYAEVSVFGRATAIRTLARMDVRLPCTGRVFAITLPWRYQ